MEKLRDDFNSQKTKTERINFCNTDYTLKPPAVPAFMTRSGCNAWMEAQVTRDADTVPTLSTPEKVQGLSNIESRVDQ